MKDDLDPFDHPPYSEDQEKAYQHKKDEFEHIESHPPADKIDLEFEEQQRLKRVKYLREYQNSGLTTYIKK